MKRFLFFMLMLCTGMSYAHVDCSELQFDGANDQSIIVFLPTTNNCSNPTFEIFLRTDEPEFTLHTNWRSFSDEGKNQAIIDGLDPCTAYDILVYVYCDGVLVGVCQTYTPYSTDGCDVDCKAMSGDGANESALILNLPTTDRCGEPTFKISLKIHNSSDPFEITQWDPFIDDGRRQAIIRELDPCTDYDILVEVFCDGQKVGECIQTFSTTGCNIDCSVITLVKAEDKTITITLPTTEGCEEPTYEIDIRNLDQLDPFKPADWTLEYNGGWEAVIQGLDPCTNYDIAVEVFCDGYRVGTCFRTLTTTGCDVDCNAMSGDGANESALILNLPTTDRCGEPTFKISLKVYNSSDPFEITQWDPFMDDGRRQAIIRELDPCTDYDILVEVYCDGQKVGECVQTFSTTGCNIDCSVMTLVKAEDKTITITLPTTEGCEEPTYEIDIRNLDQLDPFKPADWTLEYNGGWEAVIQGLDPCTNYDIAVEVFCDGYRISSCFKTYTTTGCSVNCSAMIGDGVNKSAIIVYLPTTEECEEPTYQVSIRNHDLPLPFELIEWELFYDDGWQTIIRDLDPCTSYDVLAEVFCNGEKIGECIQTFSTAGCKDGGFEGFSGESTDQTQTGLAYPNPFTSAFNLEFMLEDREPVYIVIHDVSGRVVYQSQVKANAGSNRLEINLYDVTSGTLLYSIQGARLTINGKILKVD